MRLLLHFLACAWKHQLVYDSFSKDNTLNFFSHCHREWAKCRLLSPQIKWVTTSTTKLNVHVFLEQVQKEIHTILESRRPPTFEDRKAMPYTLAVIHEIQRFANVIPHIPHATSTEINFKGYHIPKVSQLWRNDCKHSQIQPWWFLSWPFRPLRMYILSYSTVYNIKVKCHFHFQKGDFASVQ